MLIKKNHNNRKNQTGFEIIIIVIQTKVTCEASNTYI